MGRNDERRSGGGDVASEATAAIDTCGVHTTTAWPTESRPRRPARPVSWAYSPDVRPLRPCSRIFVSRSITTVRAGMLMPSDSVSVANTTCSRLAEKQSSTASRKAGIRPAWCDADARLEPGGPRPVPEHAQLVVGEPLGVLLAARAGSRARSSGVVRRMPSRQALARRRRRRRLGEKMKTMAGNMVELVEGLDELAAAGPDEARVAQSAGATGQPGHALVEGERPGMESCRACSSGTRSTRRLPFSAIGHVVAELDRPVRLDDHLGGPAHLAQPGAELVRRWTPWPTGTRRPPREGSG